MNAPLNQFDRLPPHSTESEMCVLGSMLICGDDAREVFTTVRSDITREHFFQADHQIIFDALNALYDRGDKIDVMIAVEELKRRGVFEEVGGASYLMQLVGAVPTHRYVAQYAKPMKQTYLLRCLIELSNDALRKAYAPAFEDVAEGYLRDLAAKAAKIASGASANLIHKLGDVAFEILNRPREADQRRIKTGLYELDDLTGGLRLGGKTIIGGRPGMGKSMLLKQILLNIAAAGTAVGLITVEEEKEKVAENMLANQGGVANNRIAFNNLSPPEFDSLLQTAAQMQGLPYFIIDTARRLASIVSSANLLACKYGCRVIGVDHLHIIDGPQGERREREISAISAELKWAWKDLGVAGVEAGQLNRGTDNEPPTLKSLRESGSLEQDGDLVILLHREDYYRKGEMGYKPNEILHAIVAKNKDGATGTVPLHFDEARQRIENLAANPQNIPNFAY